jgi:hypothetical protein
MYNLINLLYANSLQGDDITFPLQTLIYVRQLLLFTTEFMFVLQYRQLL